MAKKKDPQQKKEPVPFTLEKSIKERLDEIYKNPNSIFETRANLIRYCIRQQLPIIEKELEENEK